MKGKKKSAWLNVGRELLAELLLGSSPKKPDLKKLELLDFRLVDTPTPNYIQLIPRNLQNIILWFETTIEYL